MPHFVIDCSENILNIKPAEEIMQAVYDTAVSTNLFKTADIKVRINPYKYYTVENKRDDFIHVFANIMGGRNSDQKKGLSRKIVSMLKTMFPDVPIISLNVIDFDKETYSKNTMV